MPRMGDLASSDYAPIEIPPIVGGDRDPNESLPLWAAQAAALPPQSVVEPRVGMWPDYKPPRQLPDVGPPAIPGGPQIGGSSPYAAPVQKMADLAGGAALSLATPSSLTDLGLMIGTGGVGKVIGGLAAGAGTLLDPSDAEAARLRLEHPITGHAVADTVANLMKRNRTVPTKDIYEKAIQPHDIPEGSWLTPLVGDRSGSGRIVTHVGDQELQNPVWMQGGFQFMPEWLKQQIAWGSDKSPSSAIANRIRGFQAQDTPGVYGVYTAMSPMSVDASHHVSDTLSQMMKLQGDKISPTAVEQFNDRMRKVDKDFPGVTSDNLQKYLRQQPMSFRDVFAKTMNQAGALDAGFPSVAQARLAVTNPRLLDEPMYSGGQAIAKMTGDVVHGSPGFGLAPHYTYRSKLPGEYVGGFERGVPKELLWRDLAPKIAERNPSAVGKIWLTGLKGEPFGQLVDRQWQDSVAEYLRKNPMGALAQQY
jgi:hypothetical protein